MFEFIFVATLVALSAFLGFLTYLRNPSPKADQPVPVSPGVVKYGVATISSQLVPHINELPLNQASRLTFWSFDGSYFRDKTKCETLCAGLKDWLERGAHVDYIFSSAVEVPSALASLFEEFPDELSIHVVPPVLKDQRGLEIISRLTSLHPNLFEFDDTGKRAMWIEHRHLPGTTIARDVFYYDEVGTQTGGAALEFQSYRRQLDYVISICKKFAGVNRAA